MANLLSVCLKLIYSATLSPRRADVAVIIDTFKNRDLKSCRLIQPRCGSVLRASARHHFDVQHRMHLVPLMAELAVITAHPINAHATANQWRRQSDRIHDLAYNERLGLLQA